MQPQDIVVTVDIPFTSRGLDEGACVIDPTGKPFTEDNIGLAVAVRDLSSELRGAGEITGGPPLKCFASDGIGVFLKLC